MIKSRRMRWTRHEILMGKMRNAFWSENMKGRDHQEDQGLDGKRITEWILGK
jgi:hypothetical protein